MFMLLLAAHTLARSSQQEQVITSQQMALNGMYHFLAHYSREVESKSDDRGLPGSVPVV